MSFYTRSISTRKIKSRKFHLSVAAIILIAGSFHNFTAIAEELELPPGFIKLENGDVVVDDPTVAFPPEGYRINLDGKLVKEGGEVPKLKSAEKEPLAVEDPAKNQTASSEDPTEPPKAGTDELMEIPPGFHRMPNGDIMANNPSRAVAPEGYRLIEGGILRKIGEPDPTDNLPEMQPMAKAATIDDFGGVLPPGYHKMPDGTVMANSPSRAVAPEGYHLMPDGTLMPNGTAPMDHSEHGGHGAHGGMLMADYKFERMYMKGYLDTTDEVTSLELVDNTGDYRYGMTGTNMTMDMHMFMLMYHTRTYMVMLMLHYMSMEMGMFTDDGTPSTMKTSGIADTILTYQRPWKYNLGYTVGISLPTGSIDEHGPMTHSAILTEDTKYPYAMQLGSGTYDLIFGLDYQNSKGKVMYGADWQYTLRTGTNDNEYTLGDKSIIDGWVSYMHTPTVTTKYKLKWIEIGQIDGADPELIPTMSPAANADNYGGRRLDLVTTFRYENSQMTSVSAELAVPVYQNLFGPQMKTDWIFGIQFGYMF